MSDPDETEGRALYRTAAEGMAQASFPLLRKCKLLPAESLEAQNATSGEGG